MALLPDVRGMNVAEWSVFEGTAAGCAVHVIDRGIDTGPVLATRIVDIAGCRSIADLRRVVDRAQLDLLGEVVGSIVASGELPAPLPSRTPGPQYFRMHRALADVLDAALRRQSGPRESRHEDSPAQGQSRAEPLRASLPAGP